MTNLAIRVEGLSKRYQLGTIGYGSLQHDLMGWWAKVRGKDDPNSTIGQKSRLDLHGEFWALRDVSFDIRQGDRVGIIGRNGAGKSTLLKLLSRVTSPTNGMIKVKGRVASLLEVGTGFHPELTGRENVFLNGAILGMKRREIQRKFDEIVDFAGVEQFIDTPVKRYSSGMYVRLAFSVAANLDSETLIVDEVLAVGDAEFQQKCLGKMDSVSSKEGRTVLFVSHNVSAIRSLCNRGILLEKGHLSLDSEIETVVREYIQAGLGQTRGTRAVAWEGRDGDEDIELLRTWAKPLVGEEFESSVPIEIGIEVDVRRRVTNLVLGFALRNIFDETIAYVLYDDREKTEPPTVPVGKKVCRFVIPANTLAQGDYLVKFDVGIHRIKQIIGEQGALQFIVKNTDGNGRRFLVEKGSKGWEGIFRPEWSVLE